MVQSIVLIVMFASVLHTTNAKFYTDCGSKLATLDAVRVSGCSQDAEECVLHRNSNVTFDIDFTTNGAEVESVNTVVHGVIMNLPVPFPVPQPDACQDSGLECPLKPNQKYSYTAIMPVLKAYPKVSVEVKWELQNENDQDIVCLTIPARLK